MRNFITRGFLSKGNYYARHDVSDGTEDQNSSTSSRDEQETPSRTHLIIY
jgi:hypothetical protein